MKTNMKKIIFCMMLFVFAFMLAAPAVTRPVRVQAAAKAAKTTKKKYKNRVKTAKKNLKKKIPKLLSPGYANPTCDIQSSKHKGQYLICRLGGSIGEGAYEMRVKVNLKTGNCKVLESMVDIKEKFKIKVK